MSSRMDKYENANEFKTTSRTSKNESLYQKSDLDDFKEIDLNSNVSVLKDDVKNNIDVDKIREMLERKYRTNAPKRKSIDIPLEEDVNPVPIEKETREYDINEILAKAKQSQEIDYEESRLRNLKDTNYTILSGLNVSDIDAYDEENAQAEADGKAEITSERELQELIDTITELEAKNKEQTREEEIKADADFLGLGDDEEEIPEVLEESKPVLENSFYTGSLAVTDKDFDDFANIQDEIKSNSVLIKVLVFVFIIILFIVSIVLLNNYLDWGLF